MAEGIEYILLAHDYKRVDSIPCGDKWVPRPLSPLSPRSAPAVPARSTRPHFSSLFCQQARTIEPGIAILLPPWRADATLTALSTGRPRLILPHRCLTSAFSCCCKTSPTRTLVDKTLDGGRFVGDWFVPGW